MKKKKKLCPQRGWIFKYMHVNNLGYNYEVFGSL